jgi:hypothetical protein
MFDVLCDDALIVLARTGMDRHQTPFPFSLWMQAVTATSAASNQALVEGATSAGVQDILQQNHVKALLESNNGNSDYPQVDVFVNLLAYYINSNIPTDESFDMMKFWYLQRPAQQHDEEVVPFFDYPDVQEQLQRAHLMILKELVVEPQCKPNEATFALRVAVFEEEVGCVSVTFGANDPALTRSQLASLDELCRQIKIKIRMHGGGGGTGGKGGKGGILN